MRAFNTAVKRMCMRKSELIIQTEEKLLFACHHFWFKFQPHMSESFHITLVTFFIQPNGCIERQSAENTYKDMTNTFLPLREEI